MTRRNVLLTGPSRSGTTLTCELLNQVADTVALDEPMNALSMLGHEVPEPSGVPQKAVGPRHLVSRLRRLGGADRRGSPRRPPDPSLVGDNIERFLGEVRRSIEGSGVALSRNVGGKVLGKKVADDYGDEGLRVKLAELSEIPIDKELSPDFLLAIKQTSGFIALLESLVQRFEVFAVVRNPLAVITSWQTLPFHPQDGHVRLGEGIDWELRDRLARLPDRIDRQFELLHWYYGRIHRWVPERSVIRYEEMVTSRGRALAVVSERAAELDVDLENRNSRRRVHDPEQVKALGDRLLRTDGPWWHFYSEESVKELLAV